MNLATLGEDLSRHLRDRNGGRVGLGDSPFPGDNTVSTTPAVLGIATTYLSDDLAEIIHVVGVAEGTLELEGIDAGHRLKLLLSLLHAVD